MIIWDETDSRFKKGTKKRFFYFIWMKRIASLRKGTKKDFSILSG